MTVIKYLKFVLTTYKRVKVWHLSHPQKISVFCFLSQNNIEYTKITRSVNNEKVLFVFKTFRKILMTEGMHLLRLTNICYYGYNKVFMHLKEVRDDWLTTGLCSFITLFIWLYPLSVCVSVCLCVCVFVSS